MIGGSHASVSSVLHFIPSGEKVEQWSSIHSNHLWFMLMHKKHYYPRWQTRHGMSIMWVRIACVSDQGGGGSAVWKWEGRLTFSITYTPIPFPSSFGSLKAAVSGVCRPHYHFVLAWGNSCPLRCVRCLFTPTPWPCSFWLCLAPGHWPVSGCPPETVPPVKEIRGTGAPYLISLQNSAPLVWPLENRVGSTLWAVLTVLAAHPQRTKLGPSRPCWKAGVSAVTPAGSTQLKGLTLQVKY